MSLAQDIRQVNGESVADDRSSNAECFTHIDHLNQLAWDLSDSDAKEAYALSERAFAQTSAPTTGGTPYQRGVAYSLRTLGYLNMRSGDYSLGMDQLIKALAIFETLQAEGRSVDDGLIDVFDGIAGIHAQMGNLPEALDYSLKMLEAAERSHDLRRVANARNNLAHIALESGENERAFMLLRDNIQLSAQIGYPRIEVLSYLNLAHLYAQQGDPAAALPHALGGLQGAREAGFANFEVYALDYLGQICLKLGDQQTAFSYLEQALAMSRQLGSRTTEALNLLSLGKAHAKVGCLEQALDFLQQSVAVAHEIEAKQEWSSAHFALCELYERQGDTTQALVHFKEYHRLNELIAGEKANQRLEILQIVHDTKAAKREARALQQRAAELQHEISERARAEAQLQRQLAIVRALSAFSQTLLVTVQTESERRQVLAEALRYLCVPSKASNASLSKNCDDPQLGLCWQYVAVANPAHSLARPDAESATQRFPWTTVEHDIVEQLAAGKPMGGPIQQLCAGAPVWRDYLLHEAHILSAQFFPIHIGDRWWGCIAFTDKQAERIWNEDEVLLLGTAAQMLTSTIQRWQVKDQLRVLNEQLEAQVETRTAELRAAVEQLRSEVSERERAEIALQHMMASLDHRLSARTEELATFFDLSLLAGQATDLGEVFAQMLPRIVEVTRSQVICLHLFDSERRTLRLAAQQHVPHELLPAVQQVVLSTNFRRWLRNPANKPLVTIELSQLEILPPELRLTLFQTYLGAQIKTGTTVAGMIGCYRAQGASFTLDETALVIALAEQIGVMLESHRLRQHAEEIAVLHERQRLARDLHDSISQTLYSLSLFSRSANEALADGDTARLNQNLTRLEHTTLHALREMRLLLYELRPADLAQEGLIRAVELRLNTVERRANLDLHVQLDTLAELSLQQETELYYIIVEAMNNTIKHAAANHLSLILTESQNQIHLHISDDGHGFDAQRVSGGMGLNNMRERVARIGGQMTLVSAPGSGTRLDVVVPYKESYT